MKKLDIVLILVVILLIIALFIMAAIAINLWIGDGSVRNGYPSSSGVRNLLYFLKGVLKEKL